ncbi:lysophospholipid acyltransferase family protein [Streptomyces sp. CB03238]|uniref:lysophospholipid acyltransferase family protein n=1 Tax=Streptomyces sp. CB03238 TaxID=1907777 RepID=UPI00321B6C82
MSDADPRMNSALGEVMAGREITRKILSGLAVAYFRPRITGTAHIPKSGPFVVAANHLSFSDHIFLSVFVPRPVYFVGKAERLGRKGLRGRVSSWFFEQVGMIPVRRDGGRGGVAALETSRELLVQGVGVGIHPEGTRSPDGRLYRGQTGAAWLSLTTGAPVVPCGLVGTDRVQRPGRLLLKRTTFEVHFGEPLTPGEYAGREKQSFSRRQYTDRIMREIGALSGQELAPGFAVKGAALAAK